MYSSAEKATFVRQGEEREKGNMQDPTAIIVSDSLVYTTESALSHTIHDDPIAAMPD